MGTSGRVSVPALRILTYTILIKAGISAVRLMCTVAAGIALLSSAEDMSATGSIFVVAQTAGLINIVACVMCLDGIRALSSKFITTQRIMVAVLITDCFMLLPVTAQLYLMIIGKTAAASALNAIMLTLEAAESLLIGSAFLFLMKGFGESLRNEGDSASACEKLGTIYLCFAAANAAVTVFMGPDSGIPLLAAETVLALAGVILEVLIFIRVRSAAFRIWRKHAFS